MIQKAILKDLLPGSRRNIQKRNHTFKGIWKDTFENIQMVF